MGPICQHFSRWCFGLRYSGVGDASMIVHWNGTAWATFPNKTDDLLRSVWGAASDDVWAVGNSGVILHYQP